MSDAPKEAKQEPFPLLVHKRLYDLLKELGYDMNHIDYYRKAKP